MSNATGNSSFLARGGVWVVIQFVLMAAVIALGLFFQENSWPPRTSLVVSGVFLLILAAIFGLKGVAVLKSNRTPFPRPREKSELVQHGIYAQVRHPLYTSVMLALLGWAFIMESWPALLLSLLSIPFFHAKARREERWLCEKFPGYADYARRVPRFIPRLRSISFRCIMI